MSPDREPLVSVLVCRAGTVRCALPIGSVVETLRALPITPLAGAPSLVTGMATVRGAPLAVVSAGRILGAAATDRRWVVCRTDEGRTFVLAWDTVDGVARLGPDAVGRLPPLLDRCLPEAITAVGRLDRALLFLLGVSRVLPDEAWTRLAEVGA